MRRRQGMHVCEADRCEGAGRLGPGDDQRDHALHLGFWKFLLRDQRRHGSRIADTESEQKYAGDQEWSTCSGGQDEQHGAVFLAARGIDLAGKRKSSRPVCRPCLDWSDRRHHIAGKLGAAIFSHYFEKGNVRRRNNTRALEIPPTGQRALRDMFGIAGLD